MVTGGEECFTVTQHQLTEIVRRACQGITTTPVNASPKQLNYDSPRDVPKTQLDVEWRDMFHRDQRGIVGGPP